MKLMKWFRAKVQHSFGITIIDNNKGSAWYDQTASNVGNPYKTPYTQTLQLDRMLSGRADWGCFLANTTVHLRSAFTIGGGVKVSFGKNSKRERKFIEKFNEVNGIYGAYPLMFAREAEMEGKFLQLLSPDMEENTINCVQLPWLETQYEVRTAPGNYRKLTGLKYQPVGASAPVFINNPDEFVYAKFNGRVSRVNDIGPRLGPSIILMERLDKALLDWRGINHIHASPTPTIKVANSSDIDLIEQNLENNNWGIGKLLVTSGDYELKGIQRGGPNSIEQEIIALAKMLSSGTSLPVHFLGLPDLMSNRSTADSLMEVVDAGTQNERETWKGYYEALYNKAMLMSNEVFRTGLDPSKVTVETPFISGARMAELATVWLPLFSAGALSLETFLKKIPNLDPEQEQERLQQDSINLLSPLSANQRMMPNETAKA